MCMDIPNRKGGIKLKYYNGHSLYFANFGLFDVVMPSKQGMFSEKE